MVEAIVEYDYNAENEDELTIRVGDIITDIHQQDGGWWEGSLKNHRGMFPDNFVKVIKKPASNHESVVLRQDSHRKKCRVVFSYQPNNEDELELEVNDVIDVLGEVEEGWWKGVLRGKTGVFPSNFVELLDDRGAGDALKLGESRTDGNAKSRGTVIHDGMNKYKPAQHSEVERKGSFVTNKKQIENDAPTLPPKRLREQARVIYGYEAQNGDELNMKEGDIISIISKDVEDKGWWKGEIGGRVGVFPDNFVEIISSEDPLPKKPDRPEKSSSLVSRSFSDAAPMESRKASTRDIPPESKLGKRPPPDIPKKEEAERPERPDKPTAPWQLKKPQLPPPMKKPQRTGSGLSPGSNSAPSIGIVHPQPSHIKSSPNLDSAPSCVVAHDRNGETGEADELGFDSIEANSNKLTHLTVTRARNPNRRPPSHIFLKESPPSNHEKENGVVESEAPWMKEVRRNQVKRTSQIFQNNTKNTKEMAPELDERPPPKPSFARHVAENKSSNSNPHPPSTIIESEEKSPSRVSSFRQPVARSVAKEEGVPEPRINKPVVANRISSSSAEDSLSTSCSILTADDVQKELHSTRDSMTNELRQLQEEVTIMRQTIEVQFAKQMVTLQQELEDERKARRSLQLEVERLKRSVK